MVEPVFLLFPFDTSVGIRLPLAAYVEFCISFDIQNSQMTSTGTIDLRGSEILTTFFARAAFVSNFFFYHR